MKTKLSNQTSLKNLDLNESQLYALFHGQKLYVYIEDDLVLLRCSNADIARGMYDRKRADKSDIGMVL